MTETISVPLSKPLVNGDEKLSSLTFREAEVGDMIAADDVTGDFAKTTAILAAMAGVPFDVFKRLPLRDLNRITKETAQLLGNVDTPEDNGSA